MLVAESQSSSVATVFLHLQAEFDKVEAGDVNVCALPTLLDGSVHFYGLRCIELNKARAIEVGGGDSHSWA